MDAQLVLDLALEFAIAVRFFFVIVLLSLFY